MSQSAFIRILPFDIIRSINTFLYNGYTINKKPSHAIIINKRIDLYKSFTENEETNPVWIDLDKNISFNSFMIFQIKELEEKIILNYDFNIIENCSLDFLIFYLDLIIKNINYSVVNMNEGQSPRHCRNLEYYPYLLKRLILYIIKLDNSNKYIENNNTVVILKKEIIKILRQNQLTSSIVNNFISNNLL